MSDKKLEEFCDRVAWMRDTKAVPAEPIDEMIVAAYAVPMPRDCVSFENFKEWFPRMFKAALAAAPEQPAPDHSDLVKRLRDTSSGCPTCNGVDPKSCLRCRGQWPRWFWHREEAANALEVTEQNAARYRWLRKSWAYSGYDKHRLEWYLPRSYARDDLATQLDAAIDAAIAREKK